MRTFLDQVIAGTILAKNVATIAKAYARVMYM